MDETAAPIERAGSGPTDGALAMRSLGVSGAIKPGGVPITCAVVEGLESGGLGVEIIP